MFSLTQVLLLAMAHQHQTALIMLTTKWVRSFSVTCGLFSSSYAVSVFLKKLHTSVTIYLFFYWWLKKKESCPMFPLFCFNSTKFQCSWPTPAWTTGSTVGPLPISTPWLSEHPGLPWCHGSNAPCDAGHHAALQSGTAAVPAGEDGTGHRSLAYYF